MELGCGLSKWNGPYLFFYYLLSCLFLLTVPPLLYFLRPVTLPQPENSRESTSISSIPKMRSS